jgi:hypothetical protein
MSIRIEKHYLSLDSVKVTLQTTEGRKFYLSLREDGFHFFSDENSAGSLFGNPIDKSADEIFNWIADDRWSERGKRFKDRKGARPRTTKSK